MKLSIQAAGIDTLQVELNGLINPGELERALDQAAILVEGEAKLRCPVDTGRLQKSIQVHSPSPLTREIVATAPYADYVEYGTIHMAAGTPQEPLEYMSTSGKFPSYRPFLRSALYSMEARITRFFENIFNDHREEPV